MPATASHTIAVANRPRPVESGRMTQPDWAAEGSFRAFVQQSSAHLLSYLRPVVRDSGGVDPEDALQEALIRLAREWDDLPADPATRKNYIYRALRCSAVDAMRKWSGRGSARGRTRPADLELAEAVDRLDDGPRSRDSELAAIGRAIYRDAASRDEAEQTAVRAILVSALAALKPLEAQVIFGLAGHASRDELAQELGIDTTRVRNVAQEARDVLRPLILHATGAAVSAVERERLFRYLDGDLRGRERRLVKRHIAHCGTCRTIASLERDVGRAGARLVVPLPGVTAAALAGAAVAGGAATMSGTGGASVGGALAGLASKVAAAAATVAIGAGAVVVGQNQPPRHHAHHEKRAIARRAAAPAVTPARVVPSTTQAVSRAPSAQPLQRLPSRRNTSDRHVVTAQPPAGARQASRPRGVSSGAAANNEQARASSDSNAGGEFVLGGG